MKYPLNIEHFEIKVDGSDDLNLFKKGDHLRCQKPVKKPCPTWRMDHPRYRRWLGSSPFVSHTVRLFGRGPIQPDS